MTQVRKAWNDQEIEQVVGNLLITGVLLSALVVLIGGLIYLFRHGREHVGYNVFHGEPAEYRNIPGILKDVVALRGRGFIQLGLVLLIATPVARVAFAAWGFAAEKDKMYVGFTLLVLAILLYSLLGSGSAF